MKKNLQFDMVSGKVQFLLKQILSHLFCLEMTNGNNQSHPKLFGKNRNLSSRTNSFLYKMERKIDSRRKEELGNVHIHFVCEDDCHNVLINLQVLQFLLLRSKIHSSIKNLSFQIWRS